MRVTLDLGEVQEGTHPLSPDRVRICKVAGQRLARQSLVASEATRPGTIKAAGLLSY